MVVKIIYLVYNRLEYTKLTLTKLYNEVNDKYEIIIYDDMSTDGSTEYIREYVKDKNNITHIIKKFGNSWKQLNHFYENYNTDYLIKLDNDILICDNFDDIINTVIKNKKYDLFGFKLNGIGNDKTVYNKNIKMVYDRNINGVGIYNYKKMKKVLPFKPNRNLKYSGFQELRIKVINLGAKPCNIVNCKMLDLNRTKKYTKNDEYIKKGYNRKSPWMKQIKK